MGFLVYHVTSIIKLLSLFLDYKMVILRRTLQIDQSNLMCYFLAVLKHTRSSLSIFHTPIHFRCLIFEFTLLSPWDPFFNPAAFFWASYLFPKLKSLDRFIVEQKVIDIWVQSVEMSYYFTRFPMHLLSSFNLT